MENNRPTATANLKDDVRAIQAQNRLLKRYSALRRLGGYRALADEIGVNVRYVWDFLRKGLLPTNEEIRLKLLDWRPGPPKEKRPMDESMQRLYDLLRLQHVGVEHAIKKRDLLRIIYGDQAAADESYNNPYDRDLRGMIETLNHDYSALICSTPKVGYFWAQSLSEGLRAVEHLEKRARTQLDNTSHLKQNLKQQFGGQMELEI